MESEEVEEKIEVAKRQTGEGMSYTENFSN